MKAVVECLLTLRKKSLQHAFGDNLPSSITVSPRVNSPFHHHHCSTTFGGEQKKFSTSSKLQRVMSSPSVQGSVNLNSDFVFVFV